MAPIPQSIIGHSKQCGQLLADIAKDNVAHAYLFSGPKHIGKFTVARWFGLQLLAQGNPPEHFAQLKDQVERLIHADLLSVDQLWIEESQESWEEIAKTSNIPQHHRAKAPKARTDSISIEEVRILQEKLYDTGESKYFVCLIRSMERMQPAAANAFLKILEEPPSRVVFILTTESEQTLLPTIISRARVVPFHPVVPKVMKPLLTGVAEDEVGLLLHLSQGAPGKLLTLLHDPDRLRVEKQMHDQARQLWRAERPIERLQILNELFSEEHDERSALLHIAMGLLENEDKARQLARHRAYMDLVSALKTNAHRQLLLERFALAFD